MKIVLAKPISYFGEGGKTIEKESIDLDFGGLTGQDIFEVEREMILMGHPIGAQFIQSPKALGMLATKAAKIPTYSIDMMGAQDVVKVISHTMGFLMGLPTKSEPQKELEEQQ